MGDLCKNGERKGKDTRGEEGTEEGEMSGVLVEFCHLGRIVLAFINKGYL